MEELLLKILAVLKSMDAKLDQVVRSRYPQPGREEAKRREEDYYKKMADEAYQKLLKNGRRTL